MTPRLYSVHGLASYERLQVHHFAVVYPQTPETASEELPVPRPHLPRHLTWDVDGADVEMTAEVETVVAADDRVDSVVVIERKTELSSGAVDGNVVRLAVVHRAVPHLKRVFVNATAKVKIYVWLSIVYLNTKRVGTTAAEHDQTVWFQRPEVEFHRPRACRLPARQANALLTVSEGNRQPFWRCSRCVRLSDADITVNDYVSKSRLN